MAKLEFPTRTSKKTCLTSFCAMALINVFQISFKSEICEVKWGHFYNDIVNEKNIVTDIELIFGQLMTHDKI